MSTQDWHIGVVIPARNEEALLPRCLHSLMASFARLPVNVTTDIVVVVDSSTDRTLQLAQAIVRDYGTVVTTNAGAVGGARALGAEVLLQRYAGRLDRCWLANTDADCRVPANWLQDQLILATVGFEAAAGTIDVDSFAEHGPGVSERFRKTYLIHPDGSHPHVHGANLGVRADAYLRAGGWGRLATAEDHDLWGRLKQLRARSVSVAQMRVQTSGRRVGRAPLGFADALAAHNTAVA
jgi:glycosyltransferase involved in cell wall biosynthesis